MRGPTRPPVFEKELPAGASGSASFHVTSPARVREVRFLPGVYLNEDEYSFDIALRRFKKQVEKAGILSEMKKRQHYEKPSVMRKKKKAAARKRLMKKIRKLNMN